MISKKEFIKSLASKYNLPLNTIEKVIKSQFDVVESSIRSLEYAGVRLPSIGKFVVTESKRKRLDEIDATKQAE